MVGEEVFTGHYEVLADRVRQIICDIMIESPIMPERETIDGFDLPRKEQKFRRVVIPNYMDTIRYTSNGIPILKTIDERHRNFAMREYQRLINGYWFYNNGVPIWITGSHYRFLNYWKHNGALMNYWDGHRKMGWFINYCDNDPYCAGAVLMTMRQVGKSAFLGCDLYNKTTLHRDYVSSIQSRDYEAGKNFFGKNVNDPRKYEPMWLSVQSDTPSNVKDKLILRSPTKKGKSRFNEEGKKVEETGLNSKITVYASKETATDSETLSYVFRDEFAKTHSKECNLLLALSNDRMVTKVKKGKIYWTSTAEEVEANTLDIAGAVWKEANQKKKLSADDFTQNGLYRFMIPASQIYSHDEYGMPRVRENKIEIEKLISKTSKLRQAEIRRKLPETVEEMFLPSTSNRGLNASLLLECRRRAEQWDNYERYDLSWTTSTENGQLVYNRGGKVKFMLNPDSGRFYIRKGVLSSPYINNNQKDHFSGLWKPSNNHLFAIGIDPISLNDKSQEDANRMSEMGITVMSRARDEDAMVHDVNEAQGNRIVMYYRHRGEGGGMEAIEDVMKVFTLFSCAGIIEANKEGVWRWLLQNGYKYYLADKVVLDIEKRKRAGAVVNNQTFTGVGSHEEYMMLMELYLNNSADRLDVLELIEEMFMVEVGKFTKYDLCVAFSLTLKQLYKYSLEIDKEKKLKSIAPAIYSPQYR